MYLGSVAERSSAGSTCEVSGYLPHFVVRIVIGETDFTDGFAIEHLIHGTRNLVQVLLLDIYMVSAPVAG